MPDCWISFAAAIDDTFEPALQQVNFVTGVEDVIHVIKERDTAIAWTHVVTALGTEPAGLYLGIFHGCPRAPALNAGLMPFQDHHGIER